MTKRSRTTSKPVATKAAKVLNDPTATADEKSVAASALAQVERDNAVLADAIASPDNPFNRTSEQETPAMGKRGPKPKVEKVVKALEGAGMTDAAALARDAAGIPQPPVGPDQDFIKTIRAQVDAKMGVIGFPCSDAEQGDRREWILKGLTPPAGYRYKWTRVSPEYLTVVLA